MRKRVISVGSALLLAAVGFLLWNRTAQHGWAKDGKKFSRGAKAASAAKQELINQELESLSGQTWAGNYYHGDGLGVNVALGLAPRSGFAFTWNGCLGLYDLNYGEVVEENGRIKLVFKLPNDRKGFQGIAPELIPIVWGERHYLIPTDEVVSFANAVNAGFEPRESLWGRFLLRRGDEGKPAPGQPILPPEYSGYLLKDPIKAEILSIKESRLQNTTRITKVILNVGSAQRVKQGMEFYVYLPSAIAEWATVSHVNGSSSEAEIVEYAVDEKTPPPTLDWKLSTFAEMNR
jgi:hypothetical protein